MKNTVSVVMPVYNSAKFVEESIESVLNQSYEKMQLIIINDGSTDDSDAIINKYLPNDNIKYIKQLNQGPAATRNNGIKNCDGTYIAFLDSDDVWISDKIEKQVAILERPGVDVVYTGRINIDENGNFVNDTSDRKFLSGCILSELYVDNFVCMSSAVLKRQVFEAVGMLNEALVMSEDYEFWLRVAMRCEFDFICEPLVKYRIHPSQSSSRCLERLIAIENIYDSLDEQLSRQISLSTIKESKSLHHRNFGYYYMSTGDKRSAFYEYKKAFLLTPYRLSIIKHMFGLLRFR